MNKKEADGLEKISIINLKQYGVFRKHTVVSIDWNNHKTNKLLLRVYIALFLDDISPFILFKYEQKSRYSDSVIHFKYKVYITTTPCRYGGKRYWFVCPCYRNFKHCEKRVGTLYKLEDYFACRHCHNLTYRSRNENHRNRFTSLLNILTIEQKIEDISKQIKRHYYNGKPTRNQKRIDKLYGRARKNYNNYERKK